LSNLKTRKGVSSIVGTVFSIAALTIAVVYVTYMTNTLEKFNEEVITKNTELIDQGKEELSVLRTELANNKFNITVQNTGDLPINFTRLWVTNKTGTDQVFKYDLNVAVYPDGIATNIGQNIDLTILGTQSYEIMLITDRGSTEEYSISSPSQEPLLMNLVTTPDTLPDQFTTTVVYQVMNNMTTNNVLFNLRPQLDFTGSASATCASNPIPTSYESLASGDIATFVWVCSLTGADATSVTFNATLVNAKQGNWVTSTATVKVPLSTLSADTTVNSTALGISLLTDDTLILHNETSLTPAGEYQLYSGDADAGNDGKKLMLNQTTPSFFTNNGSAPVKIPTGNWIASLKLRSDAVPLSLQGDEESMIFHFEDGQGVNPDNSQGSATRDLRVGGSTVTLEDTVNGNRQASGLTWIATNSSVTGYTNHLYLASISVTPNVDVTGVTGLGLSWTQVIEECGGNGVTRTEIWRALGSANSGSIVNATLSGSSTTGAVITVNRFTGINTASPIGATGLSNDNGQLFDCTGGSENDVYSTNITTTFADSMVFGAVGTEQRNLQQAGTGYTEIADFRSASSSALAGIATEYKYQPTAGATTVTGTLSGDADYSSVAAEIKAGSTLCGTPTWQAGTGPHGNGSYYFDGNDCFESLNVVSSTDANHIDTEPDTTSLWFKTNAAVSGEDYLVYWDGAGVCNNCHYYKISLNNTGRVLFQYKTSTGVSSEITTCLSTKDYDDNQWYHVVAVRGGGGLADSCNLYITATNGTRTDNVTQDNSYTGNNVLADGRWHIATNKNTTANWFTGSVDDIIHWNSYGMSSAEADDLSKTNYGTGAHKLDFIIDKTDQDGASPQNIYNGFANNIHFKDGKALPTHDDNAYGQSVNITLASVPEITLAAGERLNFTIRYVSTTTANWEPFNVNMTIDDETMTPQPSFLDIPMPNATLPAYFTYDNDDWLIVNVTNSGTVGSWLTFAGTRATFDDISGTTSYAGIIQRVNEITIDQNNDSLFIPAGSRVGLNFSHPKSTPASTGTANLIPPGTYKMYIDLHGYDEAGQPSVRPKYVGQVLVTD